GPRRRQSGEVRPVVCPVEGPARPGAPQACSRPRAPLGCAAVNEGTIVVALGGNAVAPPGERPTISNQFRHTRASLAPIVDLARGVPVKEEQRGQWRRLAPSPRPSAVVERELIHHLVAAGHIVVACGGGGPPVYDDPTLRLEGLDAVADKDRVAAILGRDIAADVLLILTNVDAVYHAFGTPQQKAIRRLSLAQADHLLAG